MKRTLKALHFFLLTIGYYFLIFLNFKNIGKGDLKTSNGYA